MTCYLDYNATAPLRPEVLAVMQELQALPLNASSIHAAGRQAKMILEDARRTLAEIIGAFPNEIVFTASGTEANNWVVRTFSDRRIAISAIEHSSLYKTAQCFGKPLIIPVSAQGIIDIEALHNALASETKSDGILVSVMLANNETGVIQPVREVADIVHKQGGLLHCDGVQGLGKISVDFTALKCDLMTLSAHKMGGPVGAAALVVKNGLTLSPLLAGGGQEMNRRAGTENVAAIAGFAKAATLIDFSHMQQLRNWLNAFEAEVGIDQVIGAKAPRVPNTSCVMTAGLTADVQLIRLDLEGIAISAGSACSSGKIEPSHVLSAMGLDKNQASTAIRISGGWGTKEEDVRALNSAWKGLRKNSD